MEDIKGNHISYNWWSDCEVSEDEDDDHDEASIGVVDANSVHSKQNNNRYFEKKYEIVTY